MFVNPADLPARSRPCTPTWPRAGPQSIPAAIYGDPTLGGAANDTRVLGGSRPPTVVETAGGRCSAVALEVEVTAV